VLLPPLEFSSSAISAVESSELTTPSIPGVTLLNVMLSAVNVIALEEYDVVSMLSMETLLGSLMK
jgi:hypothetical protein